MILSIGLWLVPVLAFIFVMINFDGELIRLLPAGISEERREPIFNRIVFVVFLLVIFSPIYLEFPGLADYKIAVIRENGQVEYLNKFIVFEPLVKGKITRLPSLEYENKFFSHEFKINSLPRVSIDGHWFYYKIVNQNKFIKAFPPSWDDEEQKKIFQKIAEAVLLNELSAHKEEFKLNSTTEEWVQYKKRVIKALQKAFDEKDAGIEITDF